MEYKIVMKEDGSIFIYVSDDNGKTWKFVSGRSGGKVTIVHGN